MLSLDSGSAKIFFKNKIIAYNSMAIVETIKESNVMYISALFVHLGISIDNIVNCSVNLAIY